MMDQAQHLRAESGARHRVHPTPSPTNRSDTALPFGPVAGEAIEREKLRRLAKRERQMTTFTEAIATPVEAAVATAPPHAVDEWLLDVESAARITAALRLESAARDGRDLGRAWARIADQVQRRYPQAE